MDGKIRVLIVDDSSFMRNILTRLITKDPRFEIIDTAKDGVEAVEKVARLKPDVVTMDVEMPRMNGIEALKSIMTNSPVPVVMVSSLTEEGARVTMEALQIGAVDFIPKALQDQERNIFHAVGNLHDKLAAAASAKSLAATPAPSTTQPAPPVQPTPPQQTPAVPRPPLARPAAAAGKPRLVIIGSSTGGPRALMHIFQHIPEDFPLPVVVAQHMPPKFTASLAERLNELSPLQVSEAWEGEVLQGGHAYIAPGGGHLRLSLSGGNFTVRLSEDEGESFYRPSVQVLAESLLKEDESRVIAVMLTGMGSDGAKGFTDLHNKGAHVIAQNEQSCVVYGMSRNVVKQDGADQVLPLEEIPAALAKLV